VDSGSCPGVRSTLQGIVASGARATYGTEACQPRTTFHPRALFAAAFFRDGVLLAAICLASLRAANRLRLASAIAFLPAALIFRFLRGASVCAGFCPFGGWADLLWNFAHRSLCAFAMRLRAAALIVRFRRPASVPLAGSDAAERPFHSRLTSAIWPAMRWRCASRPWRAALRSSSA
jgi:hypothetical protein